MFEKIFRFQGTWRTYQQRILDRYETYSSDKKFHIVAAPGSGKTTLGIELILRIDQPTLILAPSITIREQWVERICEAFLMDSGNKDLYLSQDLKNPKQITVATYQALHSAMTGYRGELKEEEDDFQEAETVDFCGFDVVETFKKQNLGTICLDECHHLRSEWWKALEDFKKAFPDLFTVALTATPPYDSNPNMWKRYMDMCGEIDEEITIPELVKDGTLCPHQDYIYFNYPTSKERKSVDKFKESSKKMLEQMMNDDSLLAAVRTHRFLTSVEVTDEELLENPGYLSSILIYLDSRNVSCPTKFQKLLGYKKLEKMSEKWLEILLQGFLYDDTDSYVVDNVYREELIRTLKSQGMIEKRKVYLQTNKQIEKMLMTSMGKAESIKTIVDHEYQNLQKDLRLLILTDYIRKEYESAIGDDSKEINNMGVLPFFEQIRRHNPAIRLGVLCGTVIIIPSEAKNALLSMADAPEKITFQKAGHVEDYVKVEVSGNRHFITGLVSELFAKGYMQVLIGTKSLLGEGWDAPCINSLILASFVGSYMLSNQMRGRAIRTFKKDPYKTSNIWHLVCVLPQQGTMASEQTKAAGEDFETMERRMEQFLGLHYEENSIENGMRRFTAIQTPFSLDNVKKTNKKMLQLSSERKTLKDRWESALTVFSKMEVVDECAVEKNLITAVVLVDFVKMFFLLLTFIIGRTVLRGVSVNIFQITPSLESLLRILITLGLLAGILFCLYKIIDLISPYRRLKLLGKGIHKALLKAGQLNSPNSRVEAEKENAVYAIYLLGGTGHDKKLFADCVLQFYDPIENQRYILYSKRRRNNKNGYFAVPECLSKKKEDAVLFAECMKPYIGKYEAVYTRCEAGRKILLKARIKAFANKQDRILNAKKVKGALE